MSVFRLPDLGEGLSEAEILRWHVAIGDHVAADAPLVSLETGKAVVEVPAPANGRVTALHAQPGDRLAVGTPLVEFDTDLPQPADPGSVVGHVPRSPGIDADVGGHRPGPAAPTGAPHRIRAIPAARALARGLGLDLRCLSGSGPEGLITLADVMAAGLPVPITAGTPATPMPATPIVPPSLDGGSTEALRSLRRTMSQNMSAARDHVMPCTVFDDADLQAWTDDRDYTPRLLRAVAAAARTEPALNAWYDPATDTRTLFKPLHVGIAIDTGGGLLTPVIRNVQDLSLAQLRVELDRLKRAAHDRTLASEELRHCTFMLSNFGTFAGRYATPVVVPPIVAILGAGRARRDVVAVDDRMQIHRRLPLSLSFDHRVVAGGEAVRFVAAVLTDLERAE